MHCTRALRTRVQIVTLELVHVAPGAQAEVRCRSGCSIRESLTAGADGRAASSELPGLWLRRGAILEARARRAGAVGAFARIDVLGLPRGIAVRHGCLAPYDQFLPLPCGRYR